MTATCTSAGCLQITGAKLFGEVPLGTRMHNRKKQARWHRVCTKFGRQLKTRHWQAKETAARKISTMVNFPFVFHKLSQVTIYLRSHRRVKRVANKRTTESDSLADSNFFTGERFSTFWAPPLFQVQGGLKPSPSQYLFWLHWDWWHSRTQGD